jgi:hypothetical protein
MSYLPVQDERWCLLTELLSFHFKPDATTGGRPIDETVELAPFWKDNTTMLTSVDVYDASWMGYSYQEYYPTQQLLNGRNMRQLQRLSKGNSQP